MTLKEMLEAVQQLIGAAGGKRWQAKKMIRYFPDHKVYVEPFAGGAAVFFKKKPSEVEILGDVNQDYLTMLKFAQSCTDKELEEAKDLDWIVSQANWEKARAGKGHRFWNSLMKYRCSYGLKNETFNEKHTGLRVGVVDRIPKIKERLKNVRILKSDYQETIRKYDSKDTLFYIDPPYFGHEKGVPCLGAIDEEEFWKILKKIKGKFVCSLSHFSYKRAQQEGYHPQKYKTVMTMAGKGKVKDGREEIVCFNFPPTINSSWVSESASEFMVKTYDPKDASDEQLEEDWKLLGAKYGTMIEGEQTEFGSADDLLDFADDVFLEVLARDKITFRPEKMAESALALLLELLRRNVTDGPFIDSDHAEMLASGKQTAVANRDRQDLLKQMGMVISGKLAWGFMRTGEAQRVTIEEFDKLQAQHLVDPKERETRWPGARKLWIYPVRDFIPFENPLRVKLPAGEVFAQNVKFIEGTYMPKDWDIQKLSDMDLIRLHAQVHEDAVKHKEETGNPPHEGLIDRHAIIIEEMRRRKLEHRIFTELDFKTQEFLKRAGSDATKDKIKLGEVLNLLQDGFALKAPLLSFVGGAAVQGWGEDLDIHVNLPSHERKLLDTIEFRLKSCLPPAWREKVHLVPDRDGPFTNSVPFADLVVQMRSPDDRKLLKMSLAESFQEQRVKDPTKGKQAEKSRKEDRIRMWQFFRQLKAQKGYRAGEEVEWEKIKGWATELKPTSTSS